MAKNKYNTLGMLDMLSKVDDAINNKPSGKKKNTPSKDMKDLQTLPEFNVISAVPGSEYEKTLEYLKNMEASGYGGGSYVMWDKYGKPKIEILEDNTDKRAHYNSYYNTMYISDNNKYLRNFTSKVEPDVIEFIHELSHAKQEKDGRLHFGRRIIDWLKSPYFSNDGSKSFKSGFEKGDLWGKGQYETPSTIEYEAHKEIQPILQEELNKNYNKQTNYKIDVSKKQYGGITKYGDGGKTSPPKKNIAVLGVKDGSSKNYNQNIFIQTLKDYERDIEKWLGNPMQKARDIKKSEPTVTPGTRFLVNPLRLTPEQIEQRELQDNERHSAAGYYTAKAITDKFPEWSQYTGIPQAIGALGSIGLGIGHEIVSNKYTRPHENDPYTKWNVLREAIEDAGNNGAGAFMNVIPFMSESEKIDALKYMSDNNMLFDGVDLPNGKNLYWKNEKGEINKPYKKKQYGGLAKFVDGGEDPPYKKLSSETTQSQIPAYIKYLPKSVKEAEQKQELIDKAKAIQAKLEKQYYEEELASLRNSPVALGRSIALGVNPVEAKEKIEKQNKEYAKASAQEKLQEELRPVDDDYILEKAVEYGSLLAGPEVFELGALTKMGVKNLAKFFAKKPPVNTFTAKMGPFGRSIQSKVVNPTEFPKELPKDLEPYLFSDVVNSERVFYDREGNIIPEPKERWYSSPHEYLGNVELLNYSEFDPWNPSMTYYGTPVWKPSKIDRTLTYEEAFGDDVIEKTVLPTDVQQKGFFNLKGAIQKYPKGPLTKEEIEAYKNSDFYKEATRQHEDALSKYGDKWTLPNYAEKDLQEAIETGNRSRINPTLYGGRNWTASDYIIAGMIGSAYPSAAGVYGLAFSPPAVKNKALQKAGITDPRDYGTLTDKDTIIDITERPMDFAKVNQVKDGQIIIGGEFIEDANNTVRKAKDWLTATDTYSDKDYQSKDIQSFYGIENGKFKVGKASDFKSETEIVPRRFGAIDIDKAILNDKEMRLLDKEGNPIYQNTPNTGKFILYSPSTGKAQFTYINTGKSGVEKVNAFLKKNKDAQYIHLDNGRYEYYGINPEGLTEADFKKYYQQDLERKGNPGYNLILKKEGGNFSNLQKFIR